MNKKHLVKEIKQHLVNKFGNEISDVILFGSQLKEKAAENSDYDILIVLRNSYNWKTRRLINDLCYDFDLKYDIFIDTQIISLSELKTGLRGKHPVFINALKEGYRA